MISAVFNTLFYKGKTCTPCFKVLSIYQFYYPRNAYKRYIHTCMLVCHEKSRYTYFKELLIVNIKFETIHN